MNENMINVAVSSIWFSLIDCLIFTVLSKYIDIEAKLSGMKYNIITWIIKCDFSPSLYWLTDWPCPVPVILGMQHICIPQHIMQIDYWAWLMQSEISLERLYVIDSGIWQISAKIFASIWILITSEHLLYPVHVAEQCICSN